VKILATFGALALLWPMTEAGGQITSVPANTTVSTPTSGACELHVWPARGMNIAIDTSTFLFRGKAVIKALPGLDLDELLLPAVQNRIFATLNLAQMLGMTGAKIVLHDAPLPVDAQRDNGRRIASAAPCYAELIVVRIIHAELRFGDRQLQAIFLFRRFDAGTAPVREYSQSGQTGLHLFPPHTPEAVAPAVAEVDEAFKADATIFAGKSLAPPRSRNH
jgi:hypothetical protein